MVSCPVFPLSPPHCPRETCDLDLSITEHANIKLWFVAVVVVGVASSVSHNRLEQHSAQAVAAALWLFVVVVTCATPTLSVHRNLATYIFTILETTSGGNTNDSCTVVTAIPVLS